MNAVFLVLVAAFSVPGPALAAPVPSLADSVAAVLPTVRASLDTTRTTIGGRLTMRVDVDAPDGWFVEPPIPPAELGGFRVRGLQPAESTGPLPGAGAGAVTRRSFELFLVPTQLGAQQVPPLTVRARQGSGPAIELSSPPLDVEVASNLDIPAAAADSAATAEPAALKPALTAPRDWRPVYLAAAAAALACALGFAVFRRLRRRRPAPAIALPRVPRAPSRPAWDVALEELDRIALERWVDRGEIRRQYEEVTEALRRYLENRWGVPALESTTEELRRDLARSAVPPAISARVLSLLGEADLVKFAKARPEPDAARATEPRAREVVLESIPQETKETVVP